MFTSTSAARVSRSLLPLIALGLAGLGYFTPWVAPRPVGLQLSAHDLVEWLTFVQTVRDGTFPVSRLDMSLPLAGIVLLIALAPAFYTHAAGSWLKPVLHVAALGLALLAAGLILPPYPFVLSAYRDPELMPQFWLTVVAAVVAIAGLGLAWFRPAWALAACVAAALATLGLTWRAYSLAAPPIADALTKAPPVGYGLVICLCGMLGLAILAAATFLPRKPAATHENAPAM